jgi:hypothetical protein
MIPKTRSTVLVGDRRDVRMLEERHREDRSVDTKEQPTTSRCNKLHDLPPVVNDWQQTAWCPDCDYYSCGLCGNLLRQDSNASCPFDGKVLPLREVAVEASNEQPWKRPRGGLCEVQASQPGSKALEQAIKDRIVNPTGGRMQELAIELTDRELVVRGSAPCYYVKQLALHGVLEILNSVQRTKIECNFQIVVGPPAPTQSTAPVVGPSLSPEPRHRFGD